MCNDPVRQLENVTGYPRNIKYFLIPAGKCGGYTGGYSAIKHAVEGLFDDAFVTQWKRGDSVAVYWASGGRHRGGYSYRLCKIPAGGIGRENY